MAADGLIVVQSNANPADTLHRLEASIGVHGMSIFARIDHAAAAKQAGLTLLPTEVVIFGAAKAGTPLMQMDQTIGLELPLKALVWQDASGATFICYDDPEWLVNRYRLGDDANAVARKMRAALEAVVKAAAGA